MSLPPLPDVFGNYVLKDFHEIVAATPIDWLPQTPGWWFVGSVIVVLLARLLWRRLQHWYWNRYRGEAIVRLQAIADITDESFIGELNKLLKITAITAYTRPEVARLTGDAWVTFLNTRCESHQFVGEQSHMLATGSYVRQTLPQSTRESLLEASRLWVLNHRVTEHV